MKEKVNVTGVPETMKIRRQFLPETGPIYQIAKSAMDDSYVDDIDYHCENVLVIIEGLTMYLCEKDIRKMFFIIEKSFLNFFKYAPERNFYTNENQDSGYDLRFTGTVDHSFCNSPDAGKYLSAALYNGGYHGCWPGCRCGGSCRTGFC